jgi:hypothetical protein
MSAGFVDGFSKISADAAYSDSDTNSGASSLPARLAPLGAAALAYLGLRRRSSLPKNAPKKLQAMRRAAEADGFSRVHLHTKKPGSIRRFLTELSMPADSHVHLTEDRSYTMGHKKLGPVFDPDDTGYFKSKFPVGQMDSLAKQIDKGKIEEYRATRKHGLKLPKTTRARGKTIPEGMVAKRSSGSMSGTVVRQKDIAKFNAKSPILKNYKTLRSELSKRMKSGSIDSSYVGRALSTHPGHRMYLTEQFLKSPKKFVLQPGINIKNEYRVHTLYGEPMGITNKRFGMSFGNREEAEAAAKRLLKNVDPKLRDNMMALDLAQDRKGKWHIIETNAGPQSGFLTPGTTSLIAPGPHQLYKYVTGRYSRPIASAGALAAAGTTEMGRLAVKELQEPKKEEAP